MMKSLASLLQECFVKMEKKREKIWQMDPKLGRLGSWRSGSTVASLFVISL